MALASCFMNVPEGSVWKLCKSEEGKVRFSERRERREEVEMGGRREENEQLRSSLVNSSDQQRNSERSTLEEVKKENRSEQPS